jgi:hypothetical protein
MAETQTNERKTMNDEKVLNTARWFSWKYRMDQDECCQIARIAAWQYGERWDDAESDSPERKCSRNTYVSRCVFQTMFEAYRQKAKRGKKKQVLYFGAGFEQHYEERVPREEGGLTVLLRDLGDDARTVCQILFDGTLVPPRWIKTPMFLSYWYQNAITELLHCRGWDAERIDRVLEEVAA